jgi:hypothetical protein
MKFASLRITQWAFAGSMGLAFVLAGCGAPKTEAAKPEPEKLVAAAPALTPTQQRVADLRSVNDALEAYARDHGGKYPVSNGWQGFLSSAGASLGAAWIPELVPQYLAALPRDPAKSDKTDGPQYIYYSDGSDYKLIAFKIDDCGIAVETNGVRIDPNRLNADATCYAYGFWTTAAAKNF